MSTHDSELDAVTVKIPLQDHNYWADAAAEQTELALLIAEEDRILEPDEISAELVPDPAVTQPTAIPSLRAAVPRGSFAALRGTVQLGGPYWSTPQPLAATANPEVHAMRMELARLHSQMRARDAYLIELEQALDASTRQLAAAGIGSVDDAQRLLGRVRGQAFRIAELESELRHATQELSSVHRKPRPSSDGPLGRVSSG